MREEGLNERQKQVLLEIYDSFAKENAGRAAARALAEIPPIGGAAPRATPPVADTPDRPVRKQTARRAAPVKKSTRKATRGTGPAPKTTPPTKTAPVSPGSIS
jgi:hypothetical protein